MIKEIHKWVDCKDGMTAEIYCKYDDKTKEILDESVIFSNKEVNYNSQSYKNMQKENAVYKAKMLKKLPTIFGDKNLKSTQASPSAEGSVS